MRYAIHEGSKSLPMPKKRGTCPYCHSEVIAKCGPRYIWHWAHVSEADCDPWWENETDWHREWKSYFPIECQEVIHHDPKTMEKHIADVKTKNGTIIEFQNSNMTLEELHSRESFYGKMFWIVNGLGFKVNFTIGDKMPSPDADMMNDLRINTSNSISSYFVWLLSQNPDHGPNDLLRVDSKGDIHLQQALQQKYDGHYLFQWKKPRTIWYYADKPVVLDFGENGLFRLMQYPKHNFFVVKQISRDELIIKNGGNLDLNNAETQKGAITNRWSCPPKSRVDRSRFV